MKGPKDRQAEDDRVLPLSEMLYLFGKLTDNTSHFTVHSSACLCHECIHCVCRKTITLFHSRWNIHVFWFSLPLQTHLHTHTYTHIHTGLSESCLYISHHYFCLCLQPRQVPPNALNYCLIRESFNGHLQGHYPVIDVLFTDMLSRSCKSI